MQYGNEQHLYFIDIDTRTIIIRKSYRNDEEYSRIMYNMNPYFWELIVDPAICEKLRDCYSV